MPEETSSVRITNAQVYEKLIEVSNVQIEMVAELRGLKYLPGKVAEMDNRLTRLELVAKLIYTVYGAIIGAVAITVIGSL